MTSSFVVAIAALFAAVFALESSLQGSGPGLRQHSLLRWISTENWPAKVGGILIMIGVGALVRYVLMHLNAPEHLKLVGGILLSAATGVAAFACRENPERRALHFALAGTALGIAYLCAYASFGLFNYLDDLAGIALLLTIAVFAAMYSAATRSVSVAVLSMVGAYAAPAFALTPKGPLVVLGYYTLVSLLAFILVMVRSWRPLIHLSFLFTLGGGLFFGWTQGYYSPEHFSVMQPLLLILVAIHLAMPLAEQRAVPGPWLARVDAVYMFLLPLTAAVLMWSIAPRLDPEAALGFSVLGVLWLVAAGFAYQIRREVFTLHALFGCLLITAGVLIHFQHLSWPLIGLLGGTCFIVAATRLGLSSGAQTLAGLFVLFCYILLVFDGHRFPHGEPAFLNVATLENVVVAVALLAAGASIQRRDGAFVGVGMLLAGGIWGALVLASELIRADIAYLPQIIHLALIVVSLLSLGLSNESATKEKAIAVSAVALVAISLWSSQAVSEVAASALAAGTLATLLLVFHRRTSIKTEFGQRFPVEAFALPVAALIWGAALVPHLATPTNHFVFAVIAATMLATVLLARMHGWRQPAFNDFLLPATFIGSALLLIYTYALRIERGTWPVVAELLALAFLAVIALNIPKREDARAPMVTLAVLFALMLQAQVLRLFGPPGTLTLADIGRVGWPAVNSLLWAIMGATLALTSQRLASRVVWSTGAALLLISAVKLILFDFGSLGELENILAVIAAGCVFFAVAWFSPLPPKPESRE